MKTQYIIRQLEMIFTGPAWHGLTMMETLEQIKEVNVNNKFKNGHSVIQIISHMTAWRKFVIEQLRGNSDYEVSEEANFLLPTDLNKTIQTLIDSQRELIDAIESFPEENLKGIVPSRDYSFQFMLHGIAHHDLYHIGQMALLKN